MADMVTITVDEAKLKRLRRDLADIPKALPKIVSRSINKVATYTRTKIVREITADVNLKRGEVTKRNIRTKKASYKKWSATIGVSGRRVPVHHFGARQTRKGVSYRIRKSAGRQTIAGAFIAKMPSGHEGVYRRTGKTALPIIELYGPSVPQVMSGIGELAQQQLEADAGARLEREIDTQVGLLIERRQ